MDFHIALLIIYALSIIGYFIAYFVFAQWQLNKRDMSIDAYVHKHLVLMFIPFANTGLLILLLKYVVKRK